MLPQKNVNSAIIVNLEFSNWLHTLSLKLYHIGRREDAFSAAEDSDYIYCYLISSGSQSLHVLRNSDVLAAAATKESNTTTAVVNQRAGKDCECLHCVHICCLL